MNIKLKTKYVTINKIETPGDLIEVGTILEFMDSFQPIDEILK